jgi:hypothetical protein
MRYLREFFAYVELKIGEVEVHFVISAEVPQRFHSSRLP